MKIANPNHPKLGSHTTVEPIRDLKDIASIKKLLADSPRDLLLFVLGINNGLRTGDLLKLKVGQIRDLKEGDSVNIIEGKTGKTNVLMINKAVYKAMQNYLEKENPPVDAYLFKSKKGSEALTVPAVNLKIKGWARAIHLRGNFGMHSLRKTFGFIQRTEFGTSFEVLAKRFNHSSPSVTMRYLGISDKEVNNILLREI